MLLRLVVSASLAIAILMVVITFGMRTLRGVGPIGGVAPAPPAPTGIPLRQSHDLVLPRFTERDVEALRRYLAVSPADRLAEALTNADTRFLGVSGLTMSVPSVDDAPRAIREGRVHSIPGTTDAVISEEHADLVQRASRYAGAYNALLLRQGYEAR